MKTRTKLVIAGAFAAPLAFSQFAVIDVAHIADTIANGRVLISQLTQLTQTYQRITQQYNQAVYMAKSLTNLNSYRLTATNWQGMIGTNASGTTAPWLTAINNGLNTSGAWLGSTYARPSYATLSALMPSSQQGRARMDYGTMELRDGASQAAMQTIGSLRLHGSQSEAALNALERDSADSSPDQNTFAAQLNKINAAGMVAARMASDTNKAAVIQAEMQLVEMKARHDAEAAAIENEIAFRTVGMAAFREQHADMGKVLSSWHSE